MIITEIYSARDIAALNRVVKLLQKIDTRFSWLRNSDHAKVAALLASAEELVDGINQRNKSRRRG